MTTPSTAPKVTVLKSIWGALFFSQMLYLAVLHFQLKPLEGGIPLNTQWLPNLQDPMELGLFAASIGLLVASFMVPQILARASGQKPGVQPATPPDTVPQALFAPFIIRLALLEAICMQGFVLAFVKRTPNLILPFFTVSLLLFLKNFPSDVEKVKSDLLG